MAVAEEKLIVRPWPKMIFLWPTTLLTLILAFASWVTKPEQVKSVGQADPGQEMVADAQAAAGAEPTADDPRPADNANVPEATVRAAAGESEGVVLRRVSKWGSLWGALFLVVFTVNMLVLTFEFPRATSLTAAIAIIAAIFMLILLNNRYEFIAPLATLISGVNVEASAGFYMCLFFIQLALFVGMFFITRFDYWELTPNELVHHTGLLGDVERFSTAGLKLNKEIADIFEYLLAGAGRVIMQVPGQQRPVVLDNVLNIGKVERLSNQILNARVVRLEQGDGGRDRDHDAIQADEYEGA